MQTVKQLANLIRTIGDTKYIKSNSIADKIVNSAEAVIYYSNINKGSQVVDAAISASIPGILNRDYKDDGTIYNSIKHGSYWKSIQWWIDYCYKIVEE